MRSIFEQGSLSAYSQVRLDDSRSPILEHFQYGARKTTVFISHKHDDLDDLKGLLGFLENRYGVKVYIDSRDPSMPKTTSAQTALNIRERIKGCDKFILLATNGAIESKWCNWELGYGDAQKFKKHIALFQMKPENTSDSAYKGSEYMSIYPYITYYNGTETYTDGSPIPRGYYVRRQESDGKNYITPLSDWFQDR